MCDKLLVPDKGKILSNQKPGGALEIKIITSTPGYTVVTAMGTKMRKEALNSGCR